MNAPVDEIRLFMGALPPDEYEARRKLRTCRNAGTVKAARTQSGNARSLAWMATEIAADWLYAPASVENLNAVVEHLLTLLRAADQAETLGEML